MPGNPYYRSYHWEKLRSKALRRDNWTCQICGVMCLGKKRSSVSPHVDHIRERDQRVGHPTELDVLENLRVLCPTCHNRRIDPTPDKEPIGEDGFPIGSGWSD